MFKKLMLYFYLFLSTTVGTCANVPPVGNDVGVSSGMRGDVGVSSGMRGDVMFQSGNAGVSSGTNYHPYVCQPNYNQYSPRYNQYSRPYYRQQGTYYRGNQPGQRVHNQYHQSQRYYQYQGRGN